MCLKSHLTVTGSPSCAEEGRGRENTRAGLSVQAAPGRGCGPPTLIRYLQGGVPMPKLPGASLCSAGEVCALEVQLLLAKRKISRNN